MDTVIQLCGPATSCYLVLGRRCYLVDTHAPFARRKLEQQLAQHLGSPPRALAGILITHSHFDHVGNLARLASSTGARVCAGADDVAVLEGRQPPAPMSELSALGRLLRKLPWLTERYQRCVPCAVQVALRGGEQLDELGLEVIALPGHTPGAVGYVDRAAHRAFVGDAVMHLFGHISLPTLAASYSLELIESSMRRLVELDLDLMYPGHGPVIGPGASHQLARFVARRFGA